jgi:hypothetical protein
MIYEKYKKYGEIIVKDLGRKKDKISEDQKEEGMAMDEYNKKKQRKWVRYERKHSNSLWHMDWFEYEKKTT